MNALLQSTELLEVPYGQGARGDKAHFYGKKTKHKTIKFAKRTIYIDILLFEELNIAKVLNTFCVALFAFETNQSSPVRR